MTNNMSFYGGRPGKPFVITKVFNTYGELQNDANMGWSSTIPIGDYVIIGYKYNGEISAEQDKAYGGTLWQKVYRDISADAVPINYEINSGEIEINGRLHYFANNQPGGIGYKFISETGNTPEISLEHEVVAPNKQPEIEAIYKNHGGAKYNFKLPRSSNYYYFEYIENIDLIDSNGNIPNIPIEDNPNFSKIVLNNNNNITNITRNNYLGDYFIEKNVGLVYKLEEVYDITNNKNVLTLVFKTKLSVSPEPVIIPMRYAKFEEDKYIPNQISIETAIGKDEETKNLNNNYVFHIPNTPNFQISAAFATEADKIEVIKEITDTDKITYKFNFPAALKNISNFDIKYIVEGEVLPQDAKFGELGLNLREKRMDGEGNTIYEDWLYIYDPNHYPPWIPLAKINNIDIVTGNIIDELTTAPTTIIEEKESINCYSAGLMNTQLSWTGNTKNFEDLKFLSVREGLEPFKDPTPGQLYINTETKELYYEGKPLTVVSANNRRFELKVKANDWQSSGEGYYYIKYKLNNFDNYFSHLTSAPIIAVNYETFIMEDGTLTDSRNMYSLIENISFTEEIKNQKHEVTIYLKTFNTIYPMRDLVLQIWHLGETTVELIPNKSEE